MKVRGRRDVGELNGARSRRVSMMEEYRGMILDSAKGKELLKLNSWFGRQGVEYRVGSMTVGAGVEVGWKQSGGYLSGR